MVIIISKNTSSLFYIKSLFLVHSLLHVQSLARLHKLRIIFYHKSFPGKSWMNEGGGGVLLDGQSGVLILGEGGKINHQCFKYIYTICICITGTRISSQFIFIVDDIYILWANPDCPFHAYPSIFASLPRLFLLTFPVYRASFPRL